MGEGREEIMIHASSFASYDLMKCWKFLIIEIFAEVGNRHTFKYLHVIQKFTVY